jgi:hypothetical protein
VLLELLIAGFCLSKAARTAGYAPSVKFELPNLLRLASKKPLSQWKVGGEKLELFQGWKFRVDKYTYCRCYGDLRPTSCRVGRL